MNISKGILIGITVGVFFAGLGIGYAVLQSTTPATQIMTNQQMQQMWDNPQLINQWHQQMMQDPQLMDQWMNTMMDGPQLRQEMIDSMMEHDEMMDYMMNNQQMRNMMGTI